MRIYLPYAVTVALLTLSLAAPPCHAQATRAATLVQAQRAFEIVQKCDPATITTLLDDPDPIARNAACDAVMSALFQGGDKRWINAPLLVKWIQTAENADPATRPRLRHNYWTTLDAAPRSNGILAQDIVTQLAELGKSKDPATRGGAAIALGALKAHQPEAIAILTQTAKDPDPSVRLATVDAVMQSLDTQDPVPDSFRALIPAAFKDSDNHVRERAAMYMYMGGWTKEFLALANSKDPDDRALATLALYDIQRAKNAFNAVASQPASRPAGSPDPVADLQKPLTQALHHPWLWVRAQAADKLPNVYWHLAPATPVPSAKFKHDLLDALADPNPNVARDAAFALNGNINIGIPNVVWQFAREHWIDPPLPAPEPLSQDLAPIVTLCQDAQAARRLDGAARLEKLGNQARPAMPALVKLFADPDPTVRDASRRAAAAILAEQASQDGTIWPPSVNARPRPIRPRPTSSTTPNTQP